MERKTVGSQYIINELIKNQLIDSPFFFSSPTVTLFAQGNVKEYSKVVSSDKLSDYVNDILSDSKKSQTDNPIAVGVIPFSEHNPVRFIVPEKLYVSSPLRPSVLHEKAADKNPSKLTPIPNPNEYMRSVEKAVAQCNDGQLDKVVLSRALQVDTEHPIKLESFLSTLLQQNPGGYTFCSKITDSGCTRLIGSSPELLISKKGQYICSNPLAGSRRRSTDENENEALSESLRQSDKDLHEHAVVVDAVEKSLAPYCSNLYVPMMPSVIKTRAMLHLSTLIEGTAISPEMNVLKLASQLHPTPAVCGYPKHDANDFIDEAEPFDRGYFTGLIGWCDARGNGEWVVVIRCAEVQEKSLKVFAGAGIVDGSHPLSELQETGNKMRTILNALGIDLQESEMLEMAP